MERDKPQKRFCHASSYLIGGAHDDNCAVLWRRATLHVDSYVGHYIVVSLSACKLGLAAFSCLVCPTQHNPFVAPSLTTPDVRTDRCIGEDGSPVDELIHVADFEGDEEETWAVMFRMDLMYYRRALSPPIVNNGRGES